MPDDSPRIADRVLDTAGPDGNTLGMATASFALDNEKAYCRSSRRNLLCCQVHVQKGMAEAAQPDTAAQLLVLRGSGQYS